MSTSDQVDLFGSPAATPPARPTPYLLGLNPEQAEAVAHVDGPALILAGAGSGKTRVLTARIANLIHQHGVLPEQILAVTFTNKAAAEMKTRIERFVGEPPKGLWAGTFHAFGASMLRKYATRLGWTRSFSIFDGDDSLREIKRIVAATDGVHEDWEPKKFRGTISDAKNALINPAVFAERASDPYHQCAARVYATYQAALHRQNAFDFDDLLVKPVELLRSDVGRDLLRRYHDQFRYIMVDEYQDTNVAQYVLIQLLASKYKNLMVVGDDDQSIYGWRGATISNILNFERDFPGAAVVRLEENYRSTSTILGAANAVIANNRTRKGKTLRTQGAPGDRVVVAVAGTEYDEARWMAQEIGRHTARTGSHKDVAILYRTNSQSRSIEEALRRSDIPYQIVGGLAFYERREIKDAVGYLKLLVNTSDEGAFQRVINTPKRGLGEKSVETLLAYARAHHLGPVQAAGLAAMIPGIPKAGIVAFANFHALMERFREAMDTVSLGELVRMVVMESGLAAAAEKEGDEGVERVENLRELVSGATEFEAVDEESEAVGGLEALTQFLERATLRSDQDAIKSDAGVVTLMTIHAAKGLEFPVVFVGGMEDGLFPHERTRYSPDQLEEERRLFYVAITRAEKKLFLSLARERRRGREMMSAQSSPFIDEIPLALREIRHLTMGHDSRYRGGNSYGGGFPRRPQVSSGGGGYARVAPTRAPQGPMSRGKPVSHPAYGDGIVVEFREEGGESIVEVEFDDETTRSFALPNPKLVPRRR